MEILKRILRKLASYNSKAKATLSLILALVSIFPIVNALTEYFSKVCTINLNDITLLDKALGIGLLALVTLAIISIIQNLMYLIWPEKRIVCGLGQTGTSYDIQNMFRKGAKEAIIIGQNLRSFLSRPEVLPFLKRLISTYNTRVTLILTTPDAMQAINNQIALNHLKQSVDELINFRDNTLIESERNNFNVFFHKGASSLSTMIKDPDNKENGILVFTPKWSIDLEPDNRLFCVMEKWEHEDFFNKIYGTVGVMTQNDSQTLDQVRLWFNTKNQ